MHPMAKHEEYDWLNDPFDEKKIAEEQERYGMTGTAKMSGCSRMGVLIAAIVVIVILVLFAFVSCSVLTLGA